jgi:hypothetical protein
MDPIRRHLLKAAGLFVASRAFADDQQGTSMQPSSVKPRHVLCFLGKDESLLHPPQAVAKTIADFNFEIDRTYSQAKPDPHMERSFGVCWDRVFPKAWSTADEAAVLNHKAVLYLLSPPLEQQKAVAFSAAALRIVEEMIEAGATAVKGESAGIAHGLERWRSLGDQARKGAKTSQGLGMTLAVAKACRLAFAKRPLGGDRYYETVGYHLVGCDAHGGACQRDGREWHRSDATRSQAYALAGAGLRRGRFQVQSVRDRPGRGVSKGRRMPPAQIAGLSGP